MKVLLVGNGGREHAIAWKLKRDDPSIELICASGNAGIAELGECIPVKPDDVKSLLGFVNRAEVDFTFVGPEAPLALGIVDAFRREGHPIFGPSQLAAEIETSKRFAKSLMMDAGVPTATATHHHDPADALAAAARRDGPVVIKASGLAAGKGVVIAEEHAVAVRALEACLVDGTFGEAGATVLEIGRAHV